MSKVFIGTICDHNLKRADKHYFNYKILKQWKISAKSAHEAYDIAELQFAVDYPDEKREDYEVHIGWGNS